MALDTRDGRSLCRLGVPGTKWIGEVVLDITCNDGLVVCTDVDFVLVLHNYHRMEVPYECTSFQEIRRVTNWNASNDASASDATPDATLRVQAITCT